MSAQEGLVASLRQFRQGFTDEAADALEAKDARITSLESELAEARGRQRTADTIIQSISLMLGGTDEWSDAETMDAYVTRLVAEVSNHNAIQKQALEAIANLPGVDLEGSDEEVNERRAERASKAFEIAHAALAGHEQAEDGVDEAAALKWFFENKEAIERSESEFFAELRRRVEQEALS